MVYHGIPCLHHGIAWRTVFPGIFIHALLSRRARLPLHQLDYFVVNWSNRVTIDGQSWADMRLQRNKNTAVVAIIGLCRLLSSYVAAVLTGWRTRRTVIDRNISVELEFYFRVCSSQFCSHTSCVFKCQLSKLRITTHMTSPTIFYGKECVVRVIL